ncbi:MAG: hypothetical protein J07AB43_00720 [Candidatus Nanosalina sp. J07AB43]|nr:MAG: hypothetical protein J07AB43_00720 [Candidatus Nanosalina sp. J07AB43]
MSEEHTYLSPNISMSHKFSMARMYDDEDVDEETFKQYLGHCVFYGCDVDKELVDFIFV